EDLEGGAQLARSSFERNQSQFSKDRKSLDALRLAILGGTFDPIHEAHLALAREAVRQFGLDQVLFVPASHPPHKSGVTHAGYEHRVRMTELACAGESAFEVSRLEQDTTSYSIETITKVRAQLASGDELFFIIGADAFAEIET